MSILQSLCDMRSGKKVYEASSVDSPDYAVHFPNSRRSENLPSISHLRTFTMIYILLPYHHMPKRFGGISQNAKQISRCVVSKSLIHLTNTVTIASPNTARHAGMTLPYRIHQTQWPAHIYKFGEPTNPDIFFSSPIKKQEAPQPIKTPQRSFYRSTS